MVMAAIMGTGTGTRKNQKRRNFPGFLLQNNLLKKIKEQANKKSGLKDNIKKNGINNFWYRMKPDKIWDP